MGSDLPWLGKRGEHPGGLAGSQSVEGLGLEFESKGISGGGHGLQGGSRGGTSQYPDSEWVLGVVNVCEVSPGSLKESGHVWPSEYGR